MTMSYALKGKRSYQKTKIWASKEINARIASGSTLKVSSPEFSIEENKVATK
jgi:hypothetical protein